MRVTFASACSFLAAATPVVAEAPALTDPVPLVQEFNNTCRRGFPDLAMVKGHALQNGWIERKVRSLQPGPQAALEELPQFLQKGEFTLILATPKVFGGVHSCQLSAPAAKSIDTSALAAATGKTFDNAVFDITKVKGEELAKLRVSSQLLVQASVSKQRPRSATLLVRLEP